jgi:hypothetical protein
VIANWSRISQFNECRRKAWNWDALRLKAWREAEALVGGGGFHVGAAVLFSTKDVDTAAHAAEEDMRRRFFFNEDGTAKVVLAEELPSIEHTIAWTDRAVRKFAEHYEGQDVQVLWPEVSFCVPMPNSEHHCWFFHKLLYPDVPYEHCHYQGDGTGRKRCWQPHFFKGRTDAVVQWMTKVWLFEHKTNSQAPEIFYKRYLLDAQATGYMYGIWRQLGVRPEGFILNVIQKPYKNAKDQLSVGFGREPYFRSSEDLERFALEFVEQANDYERAFRAADGGNTAAVYMNTKSCTNYSRQCYYMDYCQRGFVALPDEFTDRSPDYVEEEYARIIAEQSPSNSNC